MLNAFTPSGIVVGFGPDFFLLSVWQILRVTSGFADMTVEEEEHNL